uniref:Pentraxin (PTX) domain-containing protein n=1 Tax=Mastacembelus armatus TaxID=205130 RepID=A0A3Q3MS27_9TELE
KFKFIILQPDAVLPALKELSVCILLRRNFATHWTAFVYKAPGSKDIELGLGGISSYLTVWLFGQEHHIEVELKLDEWHSVCLTWSGQAQRLRIYINGTCLHEAPVKPSLRQELAQNGTLTLGVSHYVDANGEVQQESGNNLLGDIGLFGIWEREWGAEELRRPSCADGDVVSWDLRQWKHTCPPVPDNSLYCGKYIVKSFCYIL